MSLSNVYPKKIPGFSIKGPAWGLKWEEEEWAFPLRGKGKEGWSSPVFLLGQEGGRRPLPSFGGPADTLMKKIVRSQRGTPLLFKRENYIFF